MIVVRFTDKFGKTATRSLKVRPNVGDSVSWTYGPAPTVKEVLHPDTPEMCDLVVMLD